MAFRSYDSLHVFGVVAERMSFTGAADALNLSKGAVSYQISKLERELGFNLFERNHTRIRLTPRGERLWANTQNLFSQLDRTIDTLRAEDNTAITVGTHTYFLSRWLAPRLTRFVEANPDIAVRIEPVNSLADILDRSIDLAIFWGDGDWRGMTAEPFLPSVCYPVANPALATRARAMGMVRAMRELPLLVDPTGEAAWRDWHVQAGLEFNPRHGPMQFTDGNNRVEAAVDGQGLALFDDLIEAELATGRLARVWDTATVKHSYVFALPSKACRSDGVVRFKAWLEEEAKRD